ncbi:MAG: hypothetical protein IT366_12445 [Candidatus Hydrogenedentes bacterium]|nr:hypothetical protein [Candidatus Hydrogenedentota bacterium]
MDNPKVRWDLWTLPAYLLWLVFFLIGFDPEMAYDIAREIGFVVSQNALVNSPHIVTLSLAGYFGYFAYSRCLESGLSKPDAQTQGLQFAILGLIAFLAFSPFQLISYAEIPVAKLRFIVLLVGGTKLFMWFLLLGVVARYYLLGHVNVFASMVSAFPSAHREEGKGAQENSSSVTWLEVRPRPDRAVVQTAPSQRPETGTEP